MRTLDWRTQRTELTEDSRRLLTILQTTTVLALLAAAFTLATAIGGRVLAQRRQIGLLRAIGMTPVQVTGLLVAHYLVLAALAAPFGLAGGALVAERLSANAADALGAPAHPPPSAALLALALLVALLVVALATALPAWRGGADAGAGRARARPRRHLGARLARRPVRAAAAAARGGRRRDGACVKCGGTVRLSAHHVIPRVAGGPDALGNLKTLCVACHGRASAEERRY